MVTTIEKVSTSMDHYNGIFLVKNEEESAEHRIDFLKNNINIEYETCFLRLLNKVLGKRLDLLVIPFESFYKGIDFLKIFGEGASFAVPLVVILCKNNETLPNRLPNNYYFVNNRDFNEFFINFSKLLLENRQRMDFLGANNSNHKEQILNCLTEMGFNMGANGANFIAECINEVMFDNCRPNTLCKSMYERVAINNATSSASVARCMKVAINSAWTKFTHFGMTSLNTVVNFSDFSNCPTIKEFVYYVANKLFNINRDQKLKKFFTGSN